MPRGFLHLVESLPLRIELPLHLRHTSQSADLIAVVRPFRLNALARGMKRSIEFVDLVLEHYDFALLRQNLAAPILGGALFRLALLCGTTIERGMRSWSLICRLIICSFAARLWL